MATVKQVIEALQKLPPDMEVWYYWDEGGYYYPTSSVPGRVDVISQQPVYGCHGRKEWQECEDGTGKQVCVFLPPFVKPERLEVSKSNDGPSLDDIMSGPEDEDIMAGPGP